MKDALGHGSNAGNAGIHSAAIKGLPAKMGRRHFEQIAKGHGSNTGTQGMRLVKTHTNGPHTAKVYKNPDWGENVVKFFRNGVYQSKADSHTDDMADAHATAQYQLNRYVEQDAKAGLASGAKSAPAPTHSSMGGVGMGDPQLAAQLRAFSSAHPPRNFKAEARGFNSGKREIARLKRQGK